MVHSTAENSEHSSAGGSGNALRQTSITSGQHTDMVLLRNLMHVLYDVNELVGNAEVSLD